MTLASSTRAVYLGVDAVDGGMVRFEINGKQFLAVAAGGDIVEHPAGESEVTVAR